MFFLISSTRIYSATHASSKLNYEHHTKPSLYDNHQSPLCIEPRNFTPNSRFFTPRRRQSVIRRGSWRQPTVCDRRAHTLHLFARERTSCADPRFPFARASLTLRWREDREIDEAREVCTLSPRIWETRTISQSGKIIDLVCVNTCVHSWSEWLRVIACCWVTNVCPQCCHHTSMRFSLRIHGFWDKLYKHQKQTETK